MLYIYKGEEIKKIDRQAESLGMDSFTLMEAAGSGLFRQLTDDFETSKQCFLILAGKGNNGGDGIVLARYLKTAGASCTLCFPAGLPKTEPARRHLDYYEALGYSYETEPFNLTATVMIDALLGAGTSLPLSTEMKNLCVWLNSQKAERVSIDVPTGASTDTGNCDSSVIHAHKTYIVHGYKPSRFLYPAASCYGEPSLIEIGLPQTARWTISTVSATSPSVQFKGSNAHKGTFGHGLLIAGTKSMPGSAALAALGCVSSGAGKLTVQTAEEAVSVIASHVPEAMYDFHTGVEDAHSFSAIAAGCGRPADDAMEDIVQQLLQQEKPVILDAGALAPRSYKAAKCSVIVTPHPGEFARMTGKQTKDIQLNRIQEASQYAVEQGVTVVLKGEYTVIAFSDGSGVVNTTGNEGLSKGGSGDTLTGILLALLMRHSSLEEAVKDAVYLHGLCADIWKRNRPAQALRPFNLHDWIPAAISEQKERGD
ncbi:bifunctional ADP-dependent NAD(P)H-hydrate dehydratase/NAD(P)H-hydrate epimerase [Domibacillus enclensis]|uniref:ADP-dependent (S)-NAD(P)H-hydrate dehydratase n=1 Tax=Domibacillus enclensis TaxID=1017273 RepID=A0A1N6NNC3_9BACI|nr:bifunctional ADP-dependent NAD(P)H-hydrate dehydratase/NAD(P)H-hydrate epimerase [Domibacillus enclensis]OXS80098.1 bifunctional ADP-dependent NAD(P)H-hydrate dehydratase/NAD(P)H-hydrate epimerase [Domibacillus enclensis]SIP93638.1 NAD(P)H-hydrate epimerase [Domibacillus enclensis]